MDPLTEFLSAIQSVVTCYCNSTNLANNSGNASGSNVDYSAIQRLVEGNLPPLNHACWKSYMNFHSTNYSRNLLFVNENFSVMLLCWGPGQGTPLHTHQSSDPSAAQTLVAVLRGNLSLDRDIPEGLENSKRRRVSENLTPGPCFIFSDEYLGSHSLTNDSATGNAVSLHINFPPLVHSCGNPPILRAGNTQVKTVSPRLGPLRPPVPLYTNFRSLVQILSSEIRVVNPGESHNAEEIKSITTLLASMRFNPKEFDPYVNFTRDTYTRTLVGFDVPNDSAPKFTVLCLCWDKGQMSPIHNHANSSCWVKVLRGQLREILYDVDPETNIVTQKKDSVYGPELATYINDSMGLHAMGNADEHTEAVTLHIYAPPYVVCKLYSLSNPGKVTTGNMQVVEIPKNPLREKTSCANSEAPMLNLDGLLAELKLSIRSDGSCPNAEKLLRRLHLEEHEWRELCHFDKSRYSRSLVALDRDFSLMLLCWTHKQGTPIHSHGARIRSWARVLAGCLTVRNFSPTGELTSSRKIHTGEIIVEDELSGLHQVINESEIPAVSLHLYSPPYVTMAYRENGKMVTIPMIHTAHASCCDDTYAKVRGATVFSSFAECAKDIETEMVRVDPQYLVEAIGAILERYEFHDEEIMDYINSGDQARLVATGDSGFRIEILRLNNGQRMDGITGWIKMLKGSVIQEQYDLRTGIIVSRVKLLPPGVSFSARGYSTWRTDISFDPKSDDTNAVYLHVVRPDSFSQSPNIGTMLPALLGQESLAPLSL